MCKSFAEGGQRCAHHTREKLEAKAAAVEAAVAAFADGSGVPNPAAWRAAQDEWEKAAAEYASTDEGHAHLSAQAAAAGDMDTQALLNTVIAKGEALRAANRETAALIKAVRLAKAEPVTAAAGGLVASTGVDTAPRRLPPNESLFDRPVVPDLSEKDRKAWADGLAAFDEIAPIIEQVGLHHRNGYSTESAEEVGKGLREIDEKAADPTMDDAAVAQVLREATFYQSMRMSTPRWVKEDIEQRDGQPYGEWRDAQHERSTARSKQWSEFAQPMEKVLIAQAERMLAHPAAGLKTFETAQEQHYGFTPEKLTAHPNAPMSYVRKIARNSPTKMSDEGWARLRASRLKPDGTYDDGVAMVLAMHDPDSFHRNEAYAQVEVMNFDSASEKQRAYLARNLHRLPGDTGRQAILATSLVEWAKMSSDAKERESLFRTLQGSSTAEVAAVGSKALTGAGLAVSADGAEPEEKRGLFGRRR